MRRHEQVRNQTRVSRYEGNQNFDQDYDRNDRPDADWNRTEDHFSTGHRYQDEERGASPTRNTNYYSRPRGGSDLFRNNDYDTRQTDDKNMQDARYAFGNSDAASNWVGNERKGHFGKGPKGYRRSDDRIKEDVSEALFRDQNIDATEIEVEVKEGLVVLKGTIESREAKRAAEFCVEAISGVVDVRNEITVKRNEAAQSFENSRSHFKN